jgi:hypothetical protein
MSTLDVLILNYDSFFHIIYNYNFVLPYFYYEFLHPCPVISGYVLKNKTCTLVVLARFSKNFFIST